VRRRRRRKNGGPRERRPVGDCLKGNDTPEEAGIVIARMARLMGLGVAACFEVLTVYYQSDVNGYTSEGGAVSALDHLFCVGPARKRHSL